MAAFEGALMQVLAQLLTKDSCWGNGELIPRWFIVDN